MAFRFPWQREERKAPAFVELGSGIVGAQGSRFRTTEKLLRDYAAQVLDVAGLDVLIRQAETWIESNVAVGVFSLGLALSLLPWWAAIIASILVFAAWTLASPGIASPRGVGLLRVAEAPVAQALAFVLILSYVASQGELASVWAGLSGFIAFRLGAARILLAPLLEPMLERLYPLGSPDQTLRSIILRWAIRRGITLPGMADMERRAEAFWNRSNSK